jgi:hypothetical protein
VLLARNIEELYEQVLKKYAPSLKPFPIIKAEFRSLAKNAKRVNKKSIMEP